MKKRYLPFTVLSWFKWLVVGVLVLVFSLLGYGIYLYNDIQNSKENGFEQSKELVLEETDMIKINDISRFHGDTYYHVITGETKAGKSAIAYVPVKEEEAISFYISDDFLSEDEILNDWKNNCSSCSMLGTNLAIENDNPLLEIKYIDNKDRLVYDYYSLEKGTIYTNVHLRRSLY